MDSVLPFRDRREAGRMLAKRLSLYQDKNDVIVLGLPRGGVPVAYEVATALHLPLDVFIVRKLGLPGQEELAMGAVASGGVTVVNREVCRRLPDAQKTLEKVAATERQELERREKAYRDGRAPVEVQGKTVILVDDGLATGATMLAAVRGLRQLTFARCIIGVPVASPDTCANFRDKVDGIVCVATPAEFRAVGEFYEDFRQTTDEEVRELLARAAAGRSPS